MYNSWPKTIVLCTNYNTAHQLAYPLGAVCDWLLHPATSKTQSMTENYLNLNFKFFHLAMYRAGGVIIRRDCWFIVTMMRSCNLSGFQCCAAVKSSHWLEAAIVCIRQGLLCKTAIHDGPSGANTNQSPAQRQTDVGLCTAGCFSMWQFPLLADAQTNWNISVDFIYARELCKIIH